MKTIDLLIERVLEISNSLGWEVDDRPKSLSRIIAEIDESDTGSEARVISVDRYTLLLGELASTLDNALKTWTDMQGYAAQVRAALPPSRNEDVILFLVCPSIEVEDLPEWSAICRKLVWLPPKQEIMIESSLKLFLERTSLSRPWCDTPSTAQPELDNISSTSILSDAWKKILEENLINPDCNVVVEQLIQSIES
jgi:hypothetical protein